MGRWIIPRGPFLESVATAEWVAVGVDVDVWEEDIVDGVSGEWECECEGSGVCRWA